MALILQVRGRYTGYGTPFRIRTLGPEKEWGIRKGPNVISYSAKQARSASLGPNSSGGRAILACYGL